MAAPLLHVFERNYVIVLLAAGALTTWFAIALKDHLDGTSALPTHEVLLASIRPVSQEPESPLRKSSGIAGTKSRASAGVDDVAAGTDLSRKQCKVETCRNSAKKVVLPCGCVCCPTCTKPLKDPRVAQYRCPGCKEVLYAPKNTLQRAVATAAAVEAVTLVLHFLCALCMRALDVWMSFWSKGNVSAELFGHLCWSSGFLILACIAVYKFYRTVEGHRLDWWMSWSYVPTLLGLGVLCTTHHPLVRQAVYVGVKSAWNGLLDPQEQVTISNASKLDSIKAFFLRIWSESKW